MEKKSEDIRHAKVTVKRPGGNASANAKQYRIDLPSRWARSIGITPDKRDVTLSFDGSSISIRKREDGQQDDNSNAHEEIRERQKS